MRRVSDSAKRPETPHIHPLRALVIPKSLPILITFRLWFAENSHRVKRWSRLITGFALVQLLVQALNAASGFLIIRSLEKPPYAWFTIAIGMSAALTVLSDAGISSAVTSLGGSFWHDKTKFSNLITAALQIRARLCKIAILFVTPASLWLLTKNGSSILNAILLTAAVVLPIWQISTTSILNVVNRLHSKALQLQIADAAPAIVRALMLLVLAGVGWVTPLTALIVSSFSFLIQFSVVKRQVISLLSKTSDQDEVKDFKRKISKLLIRIYPNALFGCLQGQIAIWLITFFAGTTEVADFGALSRFAIVFILVGAPISQWLAPAFSRAGTPRQMLAVFASASGLVLTMNFSLFLAGWLFPEPFLWFLGDSYADLKSELLWIFALLGSNAIMQTLWALNMSRGWVNSASMNIPLVIITYVTGLYFVRVNTVSGVAQLGIIVAFSQSVHALLVAVCHFLQSASSCKQKLTPAQGSRNVSHTEL